MKDLIDTTEMYLKTVFELVEEGVPPLRARIVERLGQSGPTVSETVARLERDGLLEMPDGRHIEFTKQGRELAVEVMRRHRISERLLYDVLKVPLPKVHAEACRWEHAVSDEVSARISHLLDDPKTDPFGNPIPCNHVLEKGIQAAAECGLIPLAEVKLPGGKSGKGAENAPVGQPVTVEVVRIAEVLQLDEEQIELFQAVGLLPGAKVAVQKFIDDEVFVDVGAEKLALPLQVAAKIFVR